MNNATNTTNAIIWILLLILARLFLELNTLAVLGNNNNYYSLLVLIIVISSVCPTMNTKQYSFTFKALSLNAAANDCCTYASGGCVNTASYPFLSFLFFIFFV